MTSYWDQGYVALDGLFPPDVLLALFERMQAELAAGGRPLSSFATRGALFRQTALEVYAYHYTPLLGFLWGLTPRIAQELGREVLPTYAYFRAYRQGDICLVHSDRTACQHSLSLTIAYSDAKPWALSVATDRTDVPRPVATDDFERQSFQSVAMRPGDGVLYQGIHHRHGRIEPNPNTWSAHLFLHWVDADGPYRDQAFDRPAIEAARRSAGQGG